MSANQDAHHADELGRRLTVEVLAPMKRAFVGKDEIIDLLGVALVAGENLFLLGPPGTAKSALVQELGRRLEGRTFEYLLTRFTEPGEIFGPFDIRKLREGELVTNTDGMLPEASLVFLDELLNANSAILNSLLSVLNERVFRRGRETRALPLLAAIGASNHLPDDDALQALFDRFLLRAHCDNVPDESLGDVLRAGWELDLGRHGAPATFSVEDVRRLHGAIRDVELGAARPVLLELVRRLRRAGFAISDRRAVKLQRPIAASALLAGRTAAAPSDLWVLRHVWDTEEQRELLSAVVDETLAQHPDPAGTPAHPRAHPTDEPDAEALARELERLEAQAAEPDERALVGDRLGALAARCQWVRDDEARAFLEERVDKLWRALEEPA